MVSSVSLRPASASQSEMSQALAFSCFAVRGASRSRDERATGDAHLREGLDGDVVSSRLRGSFRGAVQAQRGDERALRLGRGVCHARMAGGEASVASEKSNNSIRRWKPIAFDCVPKRHASASRVLAVRDARPSGASSTTRTHHSRESVRQPLEVVPGASRELARLQPRGPRFFMPLREDAGVRFHPGDVRGPGNARLPALGHDVRRDGFHRVGSTHAPLERDTRRARREVAWSRRTRGPMCVQRRFRIPYTNNAGRDATPKKQKRKKVGSSADAHARSTSSLEPDVHA